MIFYANVIPYANKTNKTNARNKQLCKEYMIYILSNNYNIIVEKNRRKPKKKKNNNDICPLANVV